MFSTVTKILATQKMKYFTHIETLIYSKLFISIYINTSTANYNTIQVFINNPI